MINKEPTLMIEVARLRWWANEIDKICELTQSEKAKRKAWGISNEIDNFIQGD